MRPEYVALDIELAEGTGQPEIIELGAVRFDRTGEGERWTSLVRPRGPLTYRIEQLTGLRDADLDSAPRLPDALDALERFVGRLPVVGQSIDLDLAYLDRAGLRLDNPAYDTFELAQLLIPGLPTYDLRQVARALGVVPGVQHRALADADTTREVFLALLERLGSLRLDTMMLVNRLATGLNWPLAPLFAGAERARTREYLESAIGRRGEVRLPDPGGVPLPAAQADAPPPLAPDPAIGPLNADDLVQALSDGGDLAQQLTGYEERAEQLDMVRAVTAALDGDEHVVVEAATGTGKSLAYLLPAVHFATRFGRRVVVSTNTINLQDQLVQKDLPALAASLPYAFRVALVKGRGNYLCLRRWQSFLRAEHFSTAEASLAIKVAIWLEQTTTGDRAELRLSTDETAAWSKICADAESCTPPRCPHHRAGVCFLARARAAAETSHIVVVNHALLLSDVATRSKVLPDYRHLVIDEGHHLEEEATNQLGVRLTEMDLGQALDRLQAGAYAVGALGDVAALFQRSGAPAGRVGAAVDRTLRAGAAVGQARSAVRDLFTDLHTFVSERPERSGADYTQLRLTAGARQDRAWRTVEDSWATLRERWLDVAKQCAELLADLEDLANGADDAPDAESGRPGVDGVAQAANDVLAELEGFLRFSESALDALDRIVTDPDRDEVYWLSVRGADLALHAAPLNVGSRLWDDLFSRKAAAIVTSATLTTVGSFRYIRQRLGLREVRELKLGSPFDYRRAALVYVPSDLPEPTQPFHQHRLVDTLVALIGALGGRTLVLFTSHGQLRQTHEALRAPLEAQRVVLLGQNIDGSRARLLETFRAGPRAVLLGTSSFWEGVDVVGEALSCLVIARLPFAVPTEPVFAARSEQFDDPFNEYAVPQAILRFKQGFGRLIRSRTDRGVVAVLDSRLRTKRYGRAFLSSLPDCTMRTGAARDLPAAARDWLDRPS